MSEEIKIAAYLGVKDEAEIIETCIAHLRAVGVDYILACDMSSTDGTAEILEKYRSDTFSILTLNNDAINLTGEAEDTWEGHALRRIRNVPADWVIFLDADEFWLPASGNLKNCADLQRADILTVERYNVVLGPQGPLIPAEMTPAHYDQLQLFTARVPDLRQELWKDPELPWITAKILPKIMVRPSKLAGLAPGQHDVAKIAPPLRRSAPKDLIIAHLVLSSPSRFARKVANIRAIFAGEGVDLSQPGESWREYGTAWHWRRWAVTADLNAEFERNVTRFDRVAELRGQGIIKSARQLLTPDVVIKVNNPRNVRPEIERYFDYVYFLRGHHNDAYDAEHLSQNTAFEFYIANCSKNRNLHPNMVFDENYYLSVNMDVADIVALGRLKSGFEHYVRWGREEGRWPQNYRESLAPGNFKLRSSCERSGHFGEMMALARAHFDADAYRAERGSDFAEISDDLAFEYFWAFGIWNGEVPTRDYDEEFYLGCYEDVAAAKVAGGFPSGFLHYIIHGVHEGRSATYGPGHLL